MDKKKVFLLGGKDLEMIKIKNLLSNHNQNFIDKNLLWGAKLSDYSDILEQYANIDTTIYGIELEQDISLPQNYIEIDHHGKNDDKKSSLEQIAKILNIELTREQKLISANDSRYISGMKSLCATQEEIANIRKQDKEAQGVTLEDEKLAKDSFELASENNTNFIFSKTSKFSAVSDFAYERFENYVIYDSSKIVFYGYKKEVILDFIKSQNIDETNCYYGGGEFGFVGIKENILTENQIKDLVSIFKEVGKKEELYSYHTFMFPFIFEEEFIPSTNWIHKFFEVEKQKDFNEYVYFYKHVQDAIYNKKEIKSGISKYYEYKEQSGTYTINCKKGIFELKLDGLSLRIFNTDVAILSFNLKNTRYSDVDSILAINDFGRRIYPQFLGERFTTDTKNALLANCITLSFGDEVYSENFEQFDKKENIKKPNLLPSFIGGLIEDNFQKDKENKTTIRPIIDDRMFVISQYMNDALVSKLQNYKDCSNQYEYETNDFWYKYIFVDGDSKTCQSKHMTKKLISESTYDRWVEWGTLFGISRYSFVAITGSWFGKNRLLPHMQTMYFQMFTLLLAYRATIIKFSDDIQNATKTSEDLTNRATIIKFSDDIQNATKTSEDLTKLSAETKEIYKNYLHFLNKLYFKEVTAQDQGIELYNQAMKIMDIEKYMNDLDHEVNQLHTYVDMLEEKERNNKLEMISKIGAVLLPPSLLAGIFGMNVLTVDATENNQLLAFVFIVSSAILGFLITLNWKSIFNIKKMFLFLLKIFISIIFALLVLNSFDLSNKFNFEFLSDSLLFNKKLESKNPELQETIIKNQPIEVTISNKKGDK